MQKKVKIEETAQQWQDVNFHLNYVRIPHLKKLVSG